VPGRPETWQPYQLTGPNPDLTTCPPAPFMPLAEWIAVVLLIAALVAAWAA
jgi:hypothetical protein